MLESHETRSRLRWHFRLRLSAFRKVKTFGSACFDFRSHETFLPLRLVSWKKINESSAHLDRAKVGLKGLCRGRRADLASHGSIKHKAFIPSHMRNQKIFPLPYLEFPQWKSETIFSGDHFWCFWNSDYKRITRSDNCLGKLFQYFELIR
jgi:hypothetical protein